MSASPISISHVFLSSGAIVKGRAFKVTGESAGVLVAAEATAATDLFYGIAEESVATGTLFRGCIYGKCSAKAAGVITAGTHKLLSVTADGELEPYAVGDVPAALFLGSRKASATAAANDEIDVFVLHGPIDTIE